MAEQTDHELEIAAICHDVKVPAGPPLKERQIARIAAGRYEGAEIDGVLGVVRPGDRVLECGSGIGLVGAVAVVKAGAAQLLSYEANPKLIPRINQLYSVNGISDRCEVRHEILAAGPDLPETVPFRVRTQYLGSRLARDGERANVVDVKVVDFKDVKPAYRPDVIIMDIEGAEAEFLAHADLSRVRAVVIELHPDVYGNVVLRECKEALLDAGMRRIADLSTRWVWTVARLG